MEWLLPFTLHRTASIGVKFIFRVPSVNFFFYPKLDLQHISAVLRVVTGSLLINVCLEGTSNLY